MIEPKRLLDEGGDDFVRDLLRSAEDDVPDAAVRTRALAQIAAGAGTAGATATTAAVIGWKWVAALVVGSSVVAAIALRTPPTPPARTETTQSPAPVPVPDSVSPLAPLSPTT